MPPSMASAPIKRSRRDTRIEAEGAEFLVLGSLLAEGISAWKAYTNFPGYDIIAGEPGQRTCRVQVKSAYWTGNRYWLIKNFDCDFICCVALNRGFRGGARARSGDGRKPPDIYVLPKKVAKGAYERTELGWASIGLGRIKDPDRYLNAWTLVADFVAA
jgi:hypothetical protein